MRRWFLFFYNLIKDTIIYSEKLSAQTLEIGMIHTHLLQAKNSDALKKFSKKLNLFKIFIEKFVNTRLFSNRPEFFKLQRLVN